MSGATDGETSFSTSSDKERLEGKRCDCIARKKSTYSRTSTKGILVEVKSESLITLTRKKK